MSGRCGKPALGGPCARSPGHRAAPCLDTVAFADHVVEERRHILLAATALEHVMVGEDLHGINVLLGAPELRRAALMAVGWDAHRDDTPFSNKIGPTFEFEFTPRPGAVEVTARSIAMTLAPQVGAATDPTAELTRILRDAVKGGAAPPMIVLDNLGEVARRGFGGDLLDWIERVAEVVPVVLGATELGWDAFAERALVLDGGALTGAAYRVTFSI